MPTGLNPFQLEVSTHSRTKAAAHADGSNSYRIRSFNTQPHEGGCQQRPPKNLHINRFNTQPHEGGCLTLTEQQEEFVDVSTHSRTKAAAFATANFQFFVKSFNTQPHEGGCI